MVKLVHEFWYDNRTNTTPTYMGIQSTRFNELLGPLDLSSSYFFIVVDEFVPFDKRIRASLTKILNFC